jgi:hypothetical protein
VSANQVLTIWQQFKREQLATLSHNPKFPIQQTWLHANKLWLWPDYLRHAVNIQKRNLSQTAWRGLMPETRETA